MEPATITEAPAPGPKAPAKSGKSPQGRNVRYPIQLRVNITPAMNESLRRVAHHFDMPEGMVGRMALKQYLAQQDPLFRQQLNSLEMNERNQG
jgi:hypothetical protein